MRRQRRRLNNKGITMVELMVTLLILSIVIVLAGSMLLSSGNIFTHSAQMNTNKLAADSVYKYLSERLIFAERMQILYPDDSIQPRYRTTFHIQDGRLYEKTADGDRDVYGDAFYQGRTLAVTARAYASHKLELTVEVRATAGTVLYRTSSTIDAVNVRQSGLTIEDRALQEIENPQLSYNAPREVTTTTAAPTTTATTTEAATTAEATTTGTTTTTTTQGTTATTKAPVTWGEPPRTVGDEILFAPLPLDNIPEVEPGVTYRKGDFVTFKGEIYRVMLDGGYWSGKMDEGPGMPHCYYNVWKPMTMDYSKRCAYEYLDIVRYNGKYYQSILKNDHNENEPGTLAWREVVYHPEDDTWKTYANWRWVTVEEHTYWDLLR